MAELPVDGSFGWVVMVLIANCILNGWMAYQVFKARKKYKVRYPALYANENENKDAKVFNCIQRGHQNCLEFMAMFFALLLLGGVQHPIVASLFGTMYIVARYSYFISYSKGDPRKRFETLGGLFFVGLAGLAVCTLSFGFHLLLN